MTKENENEGFINPIDEDKVAKNPGLIPYPHAIGSPAFAPNKAGAIKKAAIRTMEEQSHMQLNQIKEQIELLARQAEKIKTRMEVSQAVYSASMSFEPVVGNTYHLYARNEDDFVLSLIGPDEWNKNVPFKYFVATVKLLSDRTWDIIK